MNMRNKSGNEFFMLVKGTVIDNRDPRNIRRLKVRIPYLHGSKDAAGSISDSNLPWVESALMEHKLIETGTRVWIQFENGDIQLPVYTGIVNENKEISRKGGKSENDCYFNGESFDDKSNYIKEKKDYKTYYGTSRKGTEISSNESDEKECLNLFDRVGNYIRFICPISKGANSGNSSKRENINYGNLFSKLVGGASGIFWRTLSNSVIYILDKSGVSEITLANTRGGTIGISIKDNIIISNGDASVKLDKSNIVATVGSSSIIINEGGIVLDGVTIKNRSGSYNIESDSFVHNGATATFNSSTSLVSPAGPESSSPAPVDTFEVSDVDKKYS